MSSLSSSWRRSATFVIAATSWLVAGCDDKAVDPPSTIPDPSIVQEQALIAFESVGQLADGVDELVSVRRTDHRWSARRVDGGAPGRRSPGGKPRSSAGWRRTPICTPWPESCT